MRTLLAIARWALRVLGILGYVGAHARRGGAVSVRAYWRSRP